MDEARCWRSQPEEWQPLFRGLHAEFPASTALDAWSQVGGQEVVALTLGLRPGGGAAPFRLVVAVPHAHEPAPTAAIVDLASQLLRGAHLDGSPTALPASDILATALVTLLPDVNPQGRIRAPVRCWDGTTCDNEAFWRHAFGIAADGSRFGRYPEWRFSEHRPQRVGLIYEQVDDDLYVEPNVSRRATYVRAVDELFAANRYTHMLEMHQHEWPEVAILQAGLEAVPPGDRLRLEHWAERVGAAWRGVGAAPSPRPVTNRGQPREEQVIDFWSGRCPGMLRLNTEVRNNRLEPGGGREITPLPRQLGTAAAALEATLALALE